MASIKVKLRPAANSPEGSVYYQVIHDRKRRVILSGCRVWRSEWDDRRGTVIASMGSDRLSVVLSIRDRIRRDIDRLTRVVRQMESSRMNYTADDVVEEYLRLTREYSLGHFMGRIIQTLYQNGKIRTAETYTATLNSFRKFISETYGADPTESGNDVTLDSINTEMMEAYEAWHRKRGVAPNTISFYIRILRAVYNRAIDENAIENRHPFRRVYTGVDKTVKRALPIQTVKKIRALDLSLSPAMDFARDMFLISFMLRGMSFIDMAFLRKADLTDGYITYRRRKTGQKLTIEWTEEMQDILDKYPENSSDYLLPIIRQRGVNERYTYRNMSYNINRSLKSIARKVGIDISLTLYVARHSWASAAKAKGIPLSVISEGMGHDSETTTQIYLASLDTAVVDKANSIILRSI